ncbi:DUF4231 domain-containing protein [Micromonospora sp. NPDC049048]|uniref:DUF4231 domain-containing protein n=1 Tax=Micromonospora sp. NPDC049048 TaxID=3364263 RepID=UPI00371D77B5
MTAIDAAGGVHENDAAGEILELRREILVAQSKLERARGITRSIKWLATATPLAVIGLILVRSYVPESYIPDALFNILIAACIVAAAAAIGLLIYVQNEKEKAAWVPVRQLELELTLLYEARELFSSIATLPVHDRRTAYRERAQGDIRQVRKSSEHYRRIHNTFQSVIIVGSLATSTVAGLSLNAEQLRWLTVALSFAVGISAGFTGYFKFRERGFYLQQTADAIEQEWNGVELGTGRYKGLPKEEAMRVFSEEVERIRAMQRQREQSLDQPNENREAAAATG